jgi:hypothetical protein
VPFDRIVSQTRHEYWCYPNHNACEIKDRRTKCKGGRMTYGFGLWRSGYTTLIPWHWSWPSDPDPFDYLRGRHSGCGQRVDDEGEVIPAVYWACFREGYDDARYIYTLQQAIAERETSKNPACVAAVAEGRRVLAETWQSVRVQPKYLADGMWPSEEFNAIRWRLARAALGLLEHPAAAEATAPSVLPAALAATAAAAAPVAASPYDGAARAGTLEKFDLGGDFAGWRNGTAEGKAEATDAAGHAGKAGLRWTVNIDHASDGGEGGKYPVGWPRVAREFKPGELDMTRYDTLALHVRVDSTRDEVADDRTPLGLVISSHAKKGTLYSTTLDLGGEQRTWLPVQLSVKQMMAAADAGADPWKSISRVQLFVSEHDYAHGVRAVFDVGEASLLRLTAPVIAGLDAPRHVLLPGRNVAFGFDILGMGAVSRGSHTVAAALLDPAGNALAEARQDLADPRRMALPLAAMKPGTCLLRVTVIDAAGKQCSEYTHTLTAHAGPLY